MQRLWEWLDLQESDARKATRGLSSWAATTVLVVIILCVAAFVPLARDIFRLQFWPAISLYGVLLTIAVVIALVERRRDLPKRTQAAIEVVFALPFELFVASLVTFSALPGAAVFGALALFASTFYGYMFRVSLRHPYHAIGSVVVYGVAASLNPTPGHLAVFAVLGPTAVIGKLILGTWALKTGQHRAEAEHLRAAVHAQMLDDQSNQIAELADMLLDIVSRNHDVRNAVMAAHVGAETLQSLARRDTIDDQRKTLRFIAENLEGSLDRVTALLHDISRLGQERLTELAPDHVRLQPVLTRLVTDLQRRFPAVRVECAPIDATTTVRVAGGEVTLARIVENALVNACEGDGTSHAAVVQVRVDASGSHPYVRVHVKDDGPGFAPDLVDKPIQGFFTTKAGGTGLGLYTLERLTRASGGRITRGNDDGALVTIELLRSDSDATAVALL